MNRYVLLLEDTPVLFVDFTKMETHLYKEQLLPYILRGQFKEPPTGDIAGYYQVSAHNISVFKDYLSSRVLSLSRDNAKQICAACRISQDTGTENRVKICLSCKGVSVNDAFWIKEENSTLQWKDVDVKRNHLSEIVDVALEGKQPTLTTNPICPELTTKGLFKKAWIRENNTLYLLKSDKMSDFANTKAEVFASQILDCTNVPHVQYTMEQLNGLTVAKCANFIREGQSFVEAHEIIEFCKNTNIDYVKWGLDTFGKDFANISAVDYLLQNTDRHDQNYGFIMDNKTGKLIEVAPLFDHNQSIIADWLGKDVTDTLSQMLPQAETLQSAMILTAKESDICIDNTKWNMLKKKYPEQERVFTNIERRYIKIKELQLLYGKKQYGIDEYMEKFSNPKQTSIHNHHSIDITY